MASSKDRDRLEVMVLEAQGLLTVTGGVANPYITIDFGGEKRRTAVETETVDPVWDEEIMVFSESSARDIEHLVLMVKHHDPVGSVADRTIGMVIVDTATVLQAPGISTQEWYPVRRGPGMKDEDVPQGQVHIKATYFVNSLDELEGLDNDESNSEEDEDDAKAPNVLSVLVEAGRNLRPPGSRGLCDPLVLLRCGGKTKQCKAQRRTNNPKWHFQAQMANTDPHEPLVVEVQHSGALSNKLIGRARLTMVEIAQAGESFTRWLPLLDGRGVFDAVGRGEVVVTARWHFDKNFKIGSKGLPVTLATREKKSKSKVEDIKQTTVAGVFLENETNREFPLFFLSEFYRAQNLEREKQQVLEAMVGEFEYEDDHNHDVQQLRKRVEAVSAVSGAEEDLEIEEEGRERERKALIARAEFQKKRDAVLPGDYQLQVHIIEVADLKGMDASGTSDPIVYASCLGVTKHTRVRKSVTSAVFDEVLYFNLSNLSREQLMQATVNLRVLDANTFRRDSLIGSHQFDLLGVYVEKDHEVYRQWVGLLETETGRETGFQGFLKLSVTVLGPEDRQKVHNLAEEMQEELAKEAEAGASGRSGGVVLMGSAPIPQELRFLVVYVFSAKDLPGFSVVGVPWINAVVQTVMSSRFLQAIFFTTTLPPYAMVILGNMAALMTAVDIPSPRVLIQLRREKVDFAGNPPIRTTARKAKGRDGLSPGWAQELWLPVMVPPHSTTIDLSVWHKDITGRDVVAHAYFNFNHTEEKFGSVEQSPQERKPNLLKGRVKRYPGPPPIWINLYGAPRGKGNGREAEMMNRYPSRGSAYRGGMLVAMKVEGRPPSGMKNRGTRRPMEFEVPPEILPETAKYTLRAMIFQGSDIPVFKFLNAPAANMRVEVTLGRTIIDFEAKSNHNGIVEWNRGNELHTLELPADPAQIPDIIIYLVRDAPESRVSYARIPAVDVLSQRFRGEPYWQELVADKTRQGLWALGSDDFPGSLLLRLGLGRNKLARQTPWEEMRSLSQQVATAAATFPKLDSSAANRENEYAGGRDIDQVDQPQSPAAASRTMQGPLGKKKPYCLRVHLFQCRNLPSSEATGLLDPYVKVRFMGQKQKTTHEINTVHPCFYQTMEFHDMLPGDLRFAAEIRIEVWDKDNIGSNTHVASCRFSVSEATLSSGTSDRVPEPGWQKLRDTNGEPGMGEILLSLQLVSKQNAFDKIPQAPSITPTLRTAYLEVITVGVRDLKPYGFQAVAQPYVHFEMTSGGERVSFTTRASEFPSGKNANFLERKVLTVLLPDDPLFAPHLCIRVLDKRMSGLTNPVVGTCSVVVAEKMPWNGAGYLPPQSQSFNAIISCNSSDGGDETFSGNTPRTSSPSPEKKFNSGGTKASSNDKKVKGSGGGHEQRDEGDEENKAHARLRAAAEFAPPIAGRPPNFGVGAVDLGQEGGGMGLDFPPIEEDRAFEREITRPGLGASPGRGDGAGAGSECRAAKHSLLETATVEGKQGFPGTSAWYERLIIGGRNALGVIDTDEEDRWKLEDLNIDFPREWASSEFVEGRNWWLKQEGGGSEIENFLQNAPFENYPLFLGAEKLKSGVRLFPQAHRRKVGLLKGLVIVSETLPDPNFSEFVDMTRLRAPHTYCCRLYVVKGLHLQPKDLNGLADPYLQLKMGKLTIDDGKDTEKIKMETLNPEFFRSFEFPVTMPGESQLKLKLYDYDRFGPDDFIGQTVIDLEDRWFSQGWHELEREDPVASKLREAHGGPYKPLEVRDLSVLSSASPQGQVMIWLDILTLQEARRYPITELEPPALMKFEVRVVCWRSQDVEAADDFTGLRDLYCRLWMETEPKKKRETDTHWRCKDGKASWNYRIKFDVELPLKSPEQGRLVFQMWDRDVLSANDIIAETSIDLYRWFLKVYREQRSIKPYMVIKNARKQKEQEESLALRARYGGVIAVAPVGGDQPKAYSARGKRGFTNGRNSRCSEKNATPRKSNKKRAQGSDCDQSSSGPSYYGSCEESRYEEVQGWGRDVEEAVEEESVNREDKYHPSSSGESDSDGEEQALLGPSRAEEMTGAKDAQSNLRKHRVEIDDTEEVVNTIKEWFGMGEAPDDATWLELTKRDPEAGTVERMGKMLVSLELIPKEAADAQPVGSGRNEPNQNPYLPPPAGRMKFSFNPMRLSKSLLGPKAFYKVLCCCMCVIIAVLFAMAGNYITAFDAIF